jgi:hypothetical protein
MTTDCPNCERPASVNALGRCVWCDHPADQAATTRIERRIRRANLAQDWLDVEIPWGDCPPLERLYDADTATN